MRQRTQYEIPAEMREAQQRFEEWRSSQSGRGRFRKHSGHWPPRQLGNTASSGRLKCCGSTTPS
jgi:hypothetical protein